MRVVKILSMALIFLYIINNFSNIDNKCNCFLSKDVCVDRIIYNNYYYNLYLNNRVKLKSNLEMKNLFFVGFK